MPTLLGNTFVWYNLFHIGCLKRQCLMNKRISKKEKESKKKWVRKSKEHKRRWQVLIQSPDPLSRKMTGWCPRLLYDSRKENGFNHKGESRSVVSLSDCQTQTVHLSAVNPTLFSFCLHVLLGWNPCPSNNLDKTWSLEPNKAPCVIWKKDGTLWSSGLGASLGRNAQDYF